MESHGGKVLLSCANQPCDRVQQCSKLRSLLSCRADGVNRNQFGLELCCIEGVLASRPGKEILPKVLSKSAESHSEVCRILDAGWIGIATISCLIKTPEQLGHGLAT